MRDSTRSEGLRFEEEGLEFRAYPVQSESEGGWSFAESSRLYVVAPREKTASRTLLEAVHVSTKREFP